jgi:hypothetical protein
MNYLVDGVSAEEWKRRAERAEAALKVYDDDELSGAASGATFGYIMRLRADKDKAEAEAAEMRTVLEVAHRNYVKGTIWTMNAYSLEHALSTDCGQGWLSPEWASELRQDNLQWIARAAKAEAQVKLLVEALAPFAACEVESFGSVPDDKAYLWKPSQTSRELPGISIADVKRAKQALKEIKP